MLTKKMLMRKSYDGPFYDDVDLYKVGEMF